MEQLAVYGWSDATPALLESLREVAGFEAVAVGDERPAALVRARAATGLPGFQHVREMARKATFDAVLLGEGAHAADIAESAAARGANLILLGTLADADVLTRAAQAAQRHGVALTVLRPWLRSGAVAAAIERLAGRPLDMLVLEASGPRIPMQLLRDLVAFATRVLGARIVDVSATQAGEGFEGSPLTAHLRFAGGQVAVLTSRMALHPALRALGSSADGTIEIRAREDYLDTEEHRTGGEAIHERETLPPEVHHEWTRMEVTRLREATPLDLELAAGEGAALHAIETALEGSFAAAVESVPRPFQVLRGGGRNTGRAVTPNRELSLVPR